MEYINPVWAEEEGIMGMIFVLLLCLIDVNKQMLVWVLVFFFSISFFVCVGGGVFWIMQLCKYSRPCTINCMREIITHSTFVSIIY